MCTVHRTSCRSLANHKHVSFPVRTAAASLGLTTEKTCTAPSVWVLSTLGGIAAAAAAAAAAGNASLVLGHTVKHNKQTSPFMPLQASQPLTTITISSRLAHSSWGRFHESFM